ncbi:MED6 mediator subfamily complex component-domain-containing protein [Lipomyces arxii]|uniref:MED6 mediator subfamily complex component-domain-containing protein n=1 Tax=Lipomyces arxii TaxID=56418 RepID=UPI0034CE7E2E
MADQMPPLDELQWRAPEWIQAFGLRTDNVLEYFAQSPFYDRSSNNQVLKMQSQFNAPMMQPQDVQLALTTMRGIEFMIAMANAAGALWVIRKCERLSPTETVPLATYFVINENIHMAPAVYSVVSSRVLACVKNLREALVLAADKLPSFAPTLGYTYTPPVAQQQDDDAAAQWAQQQMMMQALANVRQLEIEHTYLDTPAKEVKLVQHVGAAARKSSPQSGDDCRNSAASTPDGGMPSKRKRKKLDEKSR